MKHLCSVFVIFLSILILTAVMVTAVTVTAVTVTAAGNGYLRGDADGDGEITITDATVIQRYLIDVKVPVLHEKAADLNGDGVDISDATWIQRFHAEFPNPYHIGERVEDTPEPTSDEYELPFIPRK